MAKFKWEGEVNHDAGFATFFLGTAAVRVPMRDFAIANTLHEAIEFAQRTAVQDARNKMVAEIADKYGIPTKEPTK